MAGVCSLFVLAQAALDGGAGVRAHGMGVGQLVAAYCAAGAAAGAVFGLLRRALGHWLGRTIVGWMCGTVVYGGVGLARDGWTAHNMVRAAVLGFLVGVPSAFTLGRQSAQDTPPGRLDPPAS
jgi:hypothetical protein